SCGLLTSLVQELEEKGVPSSRIGFFGFSQGCLMTLETGLRYPRPLGCLVGVSGYFHEPDVLMTERPEVSQKLLMTHGTRDGVIPITKVRDQVKRVGERGLKLEFREY